MIGRVIALLGAVWAEEEACVPPMDGMVINHYVLENCTACNRLGPVVDELLGRVEKRAVGVKYRRVVCNDCDCDGIKAFPTIEITDDKKGIGRTTGYKKYNELAGFVAKRLGLNEDALLGAIETEESRVKQLKSSDFLSGFDGEWVVLFYEDAQDPMRKIMAEIAKTETQVKFGEAHKRDVGGNEGRMSISRYPHISGINAGTFVPFMGSYDGDDFRSRLTAFVEKLARPSFEPITYAKLKQLSKTLAPGEPVYVVAYRDYDTASFYFGSLAKQFKFKTTIYRTNDPVFFEKAGFHPEETHDDHDQLVRLFVYKNGSFYACPYKLEENAEVVQWIFHTHFPFVTVLGNENFYSVFHGIKPVVLLVTEGDALLDEFNRISADRHLGTPYTNTLFVALDAAEYPLFKQSVLPLVRIPSISVFDPFASQWFHQPDEVSAGNLRKKTLSYIEDYYARRLPTYPPAPSKTRRYLAAAAIVGVLLVIITYIRRERNKKFAYYD
ncbi:hypothetical protein ECANGB1_447 [Enterospora canceri]|uniref:Thioredoxin domain-containing protein n=1 Tax=Enterospora canceri TaxID=1081671 RepID=A0A1Y1S7W3_9MICR|nr:hypothetical protein ECANGB1_447 [Enterospora canceri]